MPITPSNDRPVLGISSCLLGQEVRYDAAHKRAPWLVDVLGAHVNFEPYCPEVAIGLGIPRPPIRLTGDPGAPRVTGVADPSVDVTKPLHDYGRSIAAGLSGCAGYVFKSKSPSCGLHRVKVYPKAGAAGENKGRGAYAEEIAKGQPTLPLEEEGRLNDAVLRENFVVRIFARQRWLELHQRGLTAEGLLTFHAQHKYLVMGHSYEAYRRLGRMLSNLKGVDLEAVALQYEHGLMTALARRVTRARHVNVLQHIMGYLKQRLDAGDKAELGEVFEDYRAQRLPLVVPVTLLRHHFRRNPDEYIAMQFYLWPYPDVLGLRNLV